MAPEVWLTILFIVLTAAGYLLWVLEARSGLRNAVALVAVVCFVLALLFYDFASPPADHGDAGVMASSPAGAP
jgi:apolipoprotein N-acyltransferase